MRSPRLLGSAAEDRGSGPRPPGPVSASCPRGRPQVPAVDPWPTLIVRMCLVTLNQNRSLSGFPAWALGSLRDVTVRDPPDPLTNLLELADGSDSAAVSVGQLLGHFLGSGASGGGHQLLCAEMAEARKLARHGGLLKLDGRVRVSKKADARKGETLRV